MVNNKKNKQIAFVLKSLFLYYYEQTNLDDVYVPYEEYLIYQLKFADVTGMLTREEIYEVIQTYEEMVNDPSMVEKAEYDYDGKYYRLYDILDNCEYSLFDDLRMVQNTKRICQYGDMCYFLKGEMSAYKYQIFFDIARVSRYFNKIRALDIYLPHKNDAVIKNEQIIMMADYGKDSFTTYSKNNLRSVSWYLNTHRSDKDFDFIFGQFERGENFERLKENQIDMCGDIVHTVSTSKPKQKRKSLIDRIIDKKITIDCTD